MSTKEYIIRAGRPADKKQLVELWFKLQKFHEELDRRFVVAKDAKSRWANDIEGWIESAHHPIFVAERDNKVVGFISGQPWYPPPIYKGEVELYLNDMFVLESARRRGIATALFHTIKVWAENENHGQLRFGILNSNKISMSFWHSLGAENYFTELTLPLSEGRSNKTKTVRKIGFG